MCMLAQKGYLKAGDALKTQLHVGATLILARSLKWWRNSPASPWELAFQ